MKKIDFDNAATLIALIVVLFGVFAAAESALAGTDDGGSARAPARVTAEEARQAEMADEAIRSLAEDTKVELDIQLADHKSVAVTGSSR